MGCFVCCFGNKNSWFRVKESASRKTVPLEDHNSSSREKRARQSNPSNSMFKCFSFKLKKAARRKPSHINKQTASFNEIPIIVKVAPDHETRHGVRQQNTTVESRQSFDNVDGTCHKRRQIIDPIKTRSNQPGSLKSGRGAKLLESVCQGDPTREKRVNPPSNRRNDPVVVGVSIVMVTLVMLLVWGRACAILCTSAWFYFIGRTKENIVGASGSDSGDPDLNSQKHKKRVVLEGFLERENDGATL